MQNLDRYQKQILFLGAKGQRKLAKSKVGILGAGALGSNIANILGRAGIGTLIIADPDVIELSNLQRQMLFDEKDIGRHKAPAVAKHLGEINSEINVEAFVQSVNHDNFSEIFTECDLIMDATDSYSARFMLNRKCYRQKIPWVFSGVTASCGQSGLFVPEKTGCLACLCNEELPENDFPTVNNSGILASIVTIISSISCVSAIRFIIEKYYDNQIKFFDVWTHEFRSFDIARSDFCEVCRPEKLRSR